MLSTVKCTNNVPQQSSTSLKTLQFCKDPLMRKGQSRHSGSTL